jgi:hypothetical protein
MTNHERRLAVIATALAISLTSGSRALAAGWEMRDFETPLGDRGVALLIQAQRLPYVHLGLGCDGDTGTRWRGVAVIEEPDSRVGLGMSGDVRVRFGEISARDLWSVRTTATGRRVYTAAESTKLARRLLSEEAKSPDAQVTIEISGIAGKPIPLTFPLAGLAAKIDALSKRCADWDLKVKE